MCSALGGWRIEWRSSVSGGYAVMSGAKTAISTTTMMIPSPMMARRWRRKRRVAMRTSVSCCAATTWRPTTASVAVANPDPRVNEGVQQIDEQVGDEDARGDDQDHAHHQRRVT